MARLPASCSHAVPHTSTSAEQGDAEGEALECAANVRTALAMLSSQPESVTAPAYGVLCRVLTNVLAQPDEPKFRTLRLSNKCAGFPCAFAAV